MNDDLSKCLYDSFTDRPWNHAGQSHAAHSQIIIIIGLTPRVLYGMRNTQQKEWHTGTKHAYTLHTDSVNQAGGPHFWQKVLPRGRTGRLLHHRGVGVVARCHGCPRALSRVVKPISSRPNRVTPLVSVHLVPGVPDHS